MYGWIDSRAMRNARWWWRENWWFAAVIVVAFAPCLYVWLWPSNALTIPDNTKLADLTWGQVKNTVSLVLMAILIRCVR